MHASVVAFGLAAFGCSGSSSGGDLSGPKGSSGGPGATTNPSGSGGGAADGEALFKAPDGSSTPGSIYGVWGGSSENGGITFDMRMKMAASSMTVAARCSKAGTTTPVAGVTVTARISDTEIAVLESKEDSRKSGDLSCSAHPKPGTIPKCLEKDKNFEHDCFSLAGTTLVVFDKSPFDKITLTKLSD